jgi:hypothetical protein
VSPPSGDRATGSEYMIETGSAHLTRGFARHSCLDAESAIFFLRLVHSWDFGMEVGSKRGVVSVLYRSASISSIPVKCACIYESYDLSEPILTRSLTL